jgi:predicted metal-binding protein
MAEVFGVAAGAIGVVSLSIQLAESLQKVKRFYGAVKNAPPQVEELVEEIEIMQAYSAIWN